MHRLAYSIGTILERRLRVGMLLSLMALIGFVAVAPAQEPPLPKTDKDKEPDYAPTHPEVVLATGVSDKGEIKVEVRETKYVTYTEDVEVITKVDGKEVTSVVPVTKTRSVSIMVAKKFDLSKEGTSVITADSKPLKLEEAIKRMEKQTPILISSGGAPNPFYLQTTKPETLIIILPTPQPEGATPAKKIVPTVPK